MTATTVPAAVDRIGAALQSAESEPRETARTTPASGTAIDGASLGATPSGVTPLGPAQPTATLQVPAGVNEASPSTATASARAATTPLQAAVAGKSAVRTMEDTVAEMLRPMLRDWLDAHMPNIVEKAMKNELAEREQRKSGQKPN